VTRASSRVGELHAAAASMAMRVALRIDSSDYGSGTRGRLT
jgi:hypothetical protein